MITTLRRGTVAAVAIATVVVGALVGCETSPMAGEADPTVASRAELASPVDPFIGTGGHGHTFPGPTRPFGMVQLGPDTRLTGWDGCSGYHYSDDVIYGFSHTHLSGTGVSDYGDILVVPLTREPEKHGSESSPRLLPSKFRKATEVASPSRYAVRLDDHDVFCELAATARAGFHRYHFPATDTASIVIDLEHRDRLIGSSLEIVGDREIRGYRRSKQWADDQHVYFVARFSHPFEGSVERMPIDESSNRSSTVVDRARWATARFQFAEPTPVTVAVGISAVDMDGAAKNLDDALASVGTSGFPSATTFDAVVEDSQRVWSDSISRIDIEGGTAAQRRTFYTALYHTMIAPNLFTDVDNRYRGMDGSIHEANQHTQYTVFSLWDTYRALHPLHTILEPRRTVDWLQSFLCHYEQGGALPIWELAGDETFCMIGYHAVPVMQDALAKGLSGASNEAALRAMLSSAAENGRGLPEYRDIGFIPSDAEGESVSKTLEYAYDDWCIAEFGRAAGDTATANQFTARSQAYRNLFDPQTGFFRAKRNHTFMEPFDPAEVNFNFTEANAWQYRFAVQHDLAGLRDLLGGDAAFDSALDALFTAPAQTTGRDQADITGLIGQYAHGNEPSHHFAYLYDFVGVPWKTQLRVRQICETLYSDAPDGLCGNEDCGQMSAWYVFSALGFYPVVPGSNEYWIGTPLFPSATIHLPRGGSFRVVAKNNSADNMFIQSARLNGEPLEKTFITHEQIVAGGTLEFVMGPKPSEWGTGTDARPTSEIRGERLVAVPYVKRGTRVFRGTQTIEFGQVAAGAKLFVAVSDGRNEQAGDTTSIEFEAYRGPFDITETSIVRAYAEVDGRRSKTIEARFNRFDHDWKLTLGTEYSTQYTGGGDQALIDGLRGGGDFRTGGWQGYWDEDLVATIDMGETRKVTEVTGSFLQEQRSWIWLPDRLQLEVSTDGTTFQPAGEPWTPPAGNARREEAFTQEITIRLDETARYVRVTASKRPEGCPEGHLGHGNPSWIFIDEITVR